MHTYSHTRRTLIGLAGLILVIETGLSVGQIVLGNHWLSGIPLAAGISGCACWWIYQCALIVATGQSDPALDMLLFEQRAPDDSPVLIVGDGRSDRSSRIVGVIRPQPIEVGSPGPQQDPGGTKRRTPWRHIRAS